MARSLKWLRKVHAEMLAIDSSFDDEEVSPADNSSMVTELGAVMKLAEAMLVRAARRADGDSPRLVATAIGASAGKAKRKLATMERLEALPELKTAVAAGTVSFDQAEVMVPAVELAPEAATALLETARSGSFHELQKAAQRTARAARSEDDLVQKERRLHAQRRCRIWRSEEGAVRLEAHLSPVDGARIMVALDKETDAVVKAARKAGRHDPRERSCADALVSLLTGSAKTAGAQMLLRVDAAALRRDSVEGGETCEIEGVGQVSLATARSLLPEAVLTALVTDGTDIFSVTSSKREIWRKLEVALEERDQCCVVPGCGSCHRLQIHHWRTDVFNHGPTEIDNLCRLCAVHHRLVTQDAYLIVGGPGKWRWVVPTKIRPPAPRPPGIVPAHPRAADSPPGRPSAGPGPTGDNGPVSGGPARAAPFRPRR